VGEQREQRPLPPPGMQRRDRGGEQHPAQRGEQDQPGRQAGQPDRDQDQRHAVRLAEAEQPGQAETIPVAQLAGRAQHGKHQAALAGRQGQSDQRADGGQTRGQAQGLPQQDGRGRRPSWPAGSG
jgi:hypothetical protein